MDIKNVKAAKKDILPVLKKESKGSNHVPVLLFNNPKIHLKNLGLSKYEISMVECMHAGHIDNVFQSFHVTWTLVINKNLMKYYSDMRKILLQMTHSLYYKINGKVQKLLKTLSEIQRILYLGDDFRTPKNIWRLHICVFKHFILLKEVTPLENLNDKMSRGRLFGKSEW